MLKIAQGKSSRAVLAAALAGTAWGLVACGGGSGTTSAGNTGSAHSTTPTPMAVVDPFFKLVSELVATAPEDTQPNNIDAVPATAPDDAEPTPLI